VVTTDTIDVSHTSEVSGASKFILDTPAYRPRATASLIRYEAPEATIMSTRITKIHTSSCTCTGRLLHGQDDERDQRHAGDPVGLEPVGAGTDRVAGVVARAVGDDAGVAGVVFLDVEDDLHEVGADVGDLGEDAARDPQRGGPSDSPMAKPMKQGPA
jgi:hypothetical protein